MTEHHVTASLEALRKEAGLSLREMARRLGVPHNSYGHYENPSRFKDEYLPMQWAIKFADILEKEGVDRGRVLALAGAGEDRSGENADVRIARLSKSRRQMMMTLLSDLEAADALDRERQETRLDEGG